MAYSTGTAATVQALFDAILAFAATNIGCTVAARADKYLSGTSDLKPCQKVTIGTTAIWLRYQGGASDEVYAVATNASGVTETTWNSIVASATPSGNTGAYLITGPVTPPFAVYHLFSDGSEVHCAYEMSSGQWNHFSLGTVGAKFGTWTGGEFVSAGRYPKPPSTLSATSSMDVYTTGGSTGCAVSLHCNWIVRATYLSQSAAASMSYAGGDNEAYYLHLGNVSFGPLAGRDALIDVSPNTFNLRAPMTPVQVFLGDKAGTGTGTNQPPDYYVPVGQLTSARFINMELIAPGETVNTDWMVFPIASKNSGTTGTGVLNSRNYGLAYKK